MKPSEKVAVGGTMGNQGGETSNHPVVSLDAGGRNSGPYCGTTVRKIEGRARFVYHHDGVKGGVTTNSKAGIPS
jgi:hypothetical protein